MIQAADVRALQAGIRLNDAWSIIEAIRKEFEELPIGLLIYANLVESQGLAQFYQRAAKAGVDSILVADVPTVEAEPFAEQAQAAGIQPVLIATPASSDEQLKRVGAAVSGLHLCRYTLRRHRYRRKRPGPTPRSPKKLDAFGAPPSLLGFGISRPEHVATAIAAGAKGAISGSAVVKRIEQHLDDVDVMLGGLAASSER